MDNLDTQVVIEEDLVLTNLSVKDKREVIKLLSERLLEKGYVTPEFSEGVLKREETFPTGLPFEIPLALPHTDAKYCKKTAFAVATLKEPVKFQEMGDPEKELDVKIVVLLSLDKPENQVKWLQRLIKIFQDTNFLKEVSSSKDPKKIVKLFKNKLN